MVFIFIFDVHGCVDTLIVVEVIPRLCWLVSCQCVHINMLARASH